LYEPFADVTAQSGSSYTVSSNLWGQTNFAAGRWQGVGTTSGGANPVIASGNLSYPGLSASTGNSLALVPSSGAGARISLTNNMGGSPNSIFYSFLLKVTDISAVQSTAANNAIAALSDDPKEQGAQVQRLGARLLTKKSGAGFVLGIGRNNTTTDYAYESTVHNVGDTLFVVACNEAIPGGTNVSLWVNPPSGSFGAASAPTPSATAVLYSSSTGGINVNGPQAFALICQFTNAPSAIVDDVRVGKSWAAATGAPDVAIPPTNQTVSATSNATFSAVAFGGAAMSYRWQKDGGDLSDGGKISGSATPQLTLSNVLQADAGNYALVISNAYGVATTPAALLTVTDPVIVTQPVSQVVAPAGTAVLHVVAAGTPTLTYQWYKDSNILNNGGHVSGATTPNLTISSFSGADSGTYYVIVQNGASGSAQSTNVTLQATDPSFATQPQSATNIYGTTATFSVTMNGTAPFTYRWKKVGFGELTDGGNVSGAHTSVLSINPVSLPDAGTYYVTVTNSLASVDSDQAVLTVRDPAITSNPASTNILAGLTATFHATAVGTPSLTYQWYKGATILFNIGNISGADTDTLMVGNVSSADAGNYYLQVTGPYSTWETSSVAALTIATPFNITAQPTPRKVAPGVTTALGVAATGTALTYQWQKNNANVPGATAAGYVITNIGAPDAGTYQVIVGSQGNFLTSSPAAVSLVDPIRLYDTNLVVIRLGSGAQTLTANGNSMYLDQYAKDGTYLSTVTIPDSGAYGMVGIGPYVVPVGANSSVTGSSLSRSADGLHLSFAGYATNLSYGAALQNATATAVPRGIGLVDAQGRYSLAIAATNAFSPAIWRGAVTDGTNNYYGHARTIGTYYFGYDSTGTVVQSTWVNTRSMAIFNKNIYMAAAVNNLNGVMLINGMPTNAATGTVIIPTASTGTSDCQVSPDGNLIYVADDRASANGGGVQRWHFDGSNWNLDYTLTSNMPNGARYVTADFSGANPVVYAVTGEDPNNKLVSLVDTGAGATGTVLAMAGASQNFRGIRFGPSSATLASPALAFASDANDNLLLNWPGPFYLQSATNVTGPYLDVINGTRIYTNSAASGQRYFRLRQ
jgi:hypothetical protein